LKKCDGNVERALDWIMSHMDDPDSDEEGGMQVDSQIPNMFENESPENGLY